MPSHHGIRPDDHYGIKTAGPEAVEQYPEGAVQTRQADPGPSAALDKLKLMTEGNDFELQFGATSEAGKNAVEEGTKDRVHASDAMGDHRERPGFQRRMEFIGGTPAPTRSRALSFHPVAP